jgi:hypothetical protein
MRTIQFEARKNDKRGHPLPMHVGDVGAVRKGKVRSTEYSRFISRVGPTHPSYLPPFPFSHFRTNLSYLRLEVFYPPQFVGGCAKSGLVV